MTEQEKIQFLRLQARVLQLEAEIVDIKEQLFVQSAKDQIPDLAPKEYTGKVIYKLGETEL